MKTMLFAIWASSFCLLGFAQGDASWKQTSTTGFYNDGANWSTGVMPTNAAVATITATGAYTIQAPVNGLVENSTLFMLANGSPLSVTLDTTGTWWKKAPAKYPKDWSAFGFSPTASIGNHIFNMESMSTNSERNVFFVSNAVWRFQCNVQAATNVFESGLFDFAYKGEATRSSANWMISGYPSPAVQRTIFKPGTRTIFDMFSIRGQASDQLTVFEGGTHEFYGRIAVKSDSPNASVPNTYLVFTGSSSNLLYGGLQIGNATGNRGILRMEENAYARLSSYVELGSAVGAKGLLIITNNAVAHSFDGDVSVGKNSASKGEIYLGSNGCYRSTGSGTLKLAVGASSTGLVTVAESARMNFESTQGLAIGQNTNILAEMTVKDNAQVNMTGAAVFSIGASAATGTLHLVDNALLNMPGSGELILGSSAAGAVGVMNLSDTARLIRTNANNIRVGVQTGATGIVNIAENASVRLSGNSSNFKVVDGTGAAGFVNLSDSAVLELDGLLYLGHASSGYGELNLNGNSVVKLGTNGTVTVAGNNNATGVININDNALFYAGAVGKYFRHGSGSGSRAYLNMNSGVFAATNTIFEPYAHYGEINLAGGNSYVREYRFTGSGIVGSTNKLTVTGGRHVVGSAGMNMGNGNNRVDVSLITVNGGELISEIGGLTLGCGLANASVAPIQKLTVSGGRFTTGINAVRVASANPSFGRVELTGGELETASIAGGAASLNQGGTGYSSFLGNGGKIIFPAAGANRIENLDLAELGASGLEIVNSSLATVNQAFTDVAAVDGVIVKNGNGVLSATKTSSHALTQINVGELKLGSGVTRFGRNIRVAAGASLNVLDNVDVTSVSITNGVIKLGANKKIMAATASLSGVQILTSGWAVGSYDLIEATNLAVENLTVSGDDITQVYSLTVDGGKVTLTVTATPPAETKTWQGAGTSWNTAGNWSVGLPAKQDTALFSGADPKTVSVDSASSVSTIRFDSAAGYTVSGTKLTVFSGVENVTGNHSIAAPIEVPYTTNVIALATQPGSQLILSGALTENQITVLKKTGGGALKLSGVNSLSGAISHEGGVLEFGTAESFGAANSSATALSFKAGEIRYTGAEATATKGLTVADSSTGVTNAFVFDVRNNLTLNGAFQNTRGAPIKVGTGNLTMNFPAPGVYTVASGRGRVQFNGNPLQMNGIPSTGYSGFTVLEGGVTFKGTSAMEASMPYQTVIGAKLRQTNLTANASMTVDGCKATIGGSGEHLWVGYGINTGMPNKPELNLRNGAYVLVDALKTSGDVAAAVDAQINISGRSCLDSRWSIQFGLGNSANGKTTVSVSNSVIQCAGTGELSSGGPLDFVAGSGSVVTQTCTSGIIFKNNAAGWMRFEGGSRLYYNVIKFENASGANLLVQLNDAILQPNANNYTSRTVRAAGLGIELLAGGATVDMSSATKHTFTLPVRGTGGLIKTGAGELVFANGQENGVAGSQKTAQYTGLTEVRAGRLSVETNGVENTARIKVWAGADLNLSGSAITLGTIEGDGMITNGTLTAVMVCSFTNGATQAVSKPLFANAATSGFKVNFGRAQNDPIQITGNKIPVAMVTGTILPDVGAWRGQNMGASIFAKFSIENGIVYATFDFGGTRILFL